MVMGDCLEKMNELEPGSIDCVINDPPYGCTHNDWDNELHLEKMWECYLRVLKPHGTVVLFACSDTTDDPILPKLMISRPKEWKFYTLVFQKARTSTPFQAKDRPNRIHEDIIVFYRNAQHTYNPQMWEKQNWGNHRNLNMKDKSLRYPTSILPVFPREKKSPNATAKPVGTMEWLVKTYTDEGDTVLDNTMGSGSTGVACANTHRNFVGIELDEEMFKFAEHRVNKAYAKTLREELEEEEGAVDPASISLPERLPKFEVKDFMTFYETVSQLSDYDLQVSWCVQYLNQYFCIVNGNSYEVVECEYAEYEEAISDTPVMESERAKVQYPLRYTIRTPAEVKLRFRKCAFYNEVGKKTDLFDVWSRSLEAREYAERVFDPTCETADDPVVLNTFVGLKANLEILSDHMNTSMTNITEDSESIQTILHHVYNLVGCNKTYYNYLLDWLAYPIQTGKKTNVAVIAKGGQGCGKTLFFTNFIGQMIYGDELFAKIAGGAQIGGDFNAHITGRMYLAIEEPNKFRQDKLNLLKDLITTDVTEVNAKGKNQYFAEDHTNYVFTCNFIPDQMLEADDRRYFIIQDSGNKVGDHEFFQDLSFEMKNSYQDFYKFLKMRDIDTFVFGQAPPQTGIKELLLTQTIDPIFKYLQHLAETDALENYYRRPADKLPVLPWKAFFKNAVAWCEKECEEITWKTKPLALKALLKDKLGTKEISFEGVVVSMPNYEQGGRRNERCVIFTSSSTDLIDLLMAKKVYVSEDTLEEPLMQDETDTPMDDYETLLAEEMGKAQIIELNNMRAKLAKLQNEDTKFDKE